MDQFLRTAKSQSKWYGLSSDHKADPAAVSNWSTESLRLNSCYSRIARQSGLTSNRPPPPPPPPPPACRCILREALQRWEKSAREATVICIKAASFNRRFILGKVLDHVLGKKSSHFQCILITGFLLDVKFLVGRG